MSLIDRIFAGKVIKDFGILEEKSLGIAGTRVSALLVERQGRLRFVLKFSAWAFLSASVVYHDLALNNASKLRDFITESEQIATNQPPSTYNANKSGLRASLITLLVAMTILLLAKDDGWVFFVTFLASAIQVNWFFTFRDHPDVSRRTKWLMATLGGLTVVFGISKFLWLNAATLELAARAISYYLHYRQRSR